MRHSVATKPKPVAGRATRSAVAPSVETLRPAASRDIRSTEAFGFSRGLVLALARRVASISCLFFLDFCGLVLGLYAALALRDAYRGTDLLWGLIWDELTNVLAFVTLVMILVFWQAGLYGARELRGGFGRIVSSVVIVALLTLAFGLGTGHSFGTLGIFPVGVVLISVAIGVFRGGYEAVTEAVMRLAGVKRRALLIGDGESLTRLHHALGARRVGIDYEFIGAVTRSPSAAGLRVLGPVEALTQVLDEHAVDEVIVNDSDFADADLIEIVDQAHRRHVHVRIAPKTTELLTQRGEYVAGQAVPLFEVRPPYFVGTEWALKRAFDIAVSALVVTVGLPVWLAIAAAIKLTSRGPVFYRDQRVGLQEQEFVMLKFRTMEAGADRRQDELESANEADGPLFKIRDDPRITGVGAVLRRLSLDEIPQVLNVLRGEMSLVGPRPLRLRDYALLEDWHRKRSLVLPGMTGLWQISGRSSLSFDDLVRLDFYYLDNWSIWLDISILVKTVPAVLAARGAY
jgi:exopolysaccharide biosynthesis polyprenyl glycosylphosphotransferase